MSAISKMLINMVPAMEELCALEGSCPIASASSNQQAHQLARYPVQRNSAAASSSSSNTPSGSLAFRTLVPSDHPELTERLKVILKNNLAPVTYADELVRPFLVLLTVKQGATWFAKELSDDDRPIERIAHAILQNFDPSSGVIPLTTTKALREVVSDMYQVFLQNKCQLEKPVKCVEKPSPIPNWYQEDLTTYAHPIQALGSNVAIVNVPSRYAAKAAITWGCLGHEVAGHDILGAFPDALDEIREYLDVALEEANLGGTTPYWNRWLEEAAADVLGILNMGPAGALSQIGLFRSIGREEGFKLSPVAYPKDTHPIFLVRGYLAAFTVANLSSEKKPFDQGADYAQLIRAEVDKDAEGVEELELDTINLGKDEDLEKNLGEFCKKYSLTLPRVPLIKDRELQLRQWVAKKCEDPVFEKTFIRFLEAKKIPQTHREVRNGDIQGMQAITRLMPLKDFKDSAEIVAKIIMHTKLKALGGRWGRSFHEIKSWTNEDEEICKLFRSIIQSRSTVNLFKAYPEGCFASHVVAAAVLESVIEKGKEKLTEASIQQVFNHMIAILQTMHQSNPEWQIASSPKIAPRANIYTPSNQLLMEMVRVTHDDNKRRADNGTLIFGVSGKRASSAQVAPSEASSSIPSGGMQRLIASFLKDHEKENNNLPIGYRSVNMRAPNNALVREEAPPRRQY